MKKNDQLQDMVVKAWDYVWACGKNWTAAEKELAGMIRDNPSMFSNRSVSGESLYFGKSLDEAMKKTAGWAMVKETSSQVFLGTEASTKITTMCRAQFVSQYRGQFIIEASEIRNLLEWEKVLQPLMISNQRITLVSPGEIPREDLADFTEKYPAEQTTRLLIARAENRLSGKITKEEKSTSEQNLKALEDRQKKISLNRGPER